MIMTSPQHNRVCNVLWVFSGVCLCAMVVSAITGGLETGLTPEPTHLRNRKVGVIGGSLELDYVLKKQGNPVVFDQVHQLAGDCSSGQKTIKLCFRRTG